MKIYLKLVTAFVLFNVSSCAQFSLNSRTSHDESVVPESQVAIIFTSKGEQMALVDKVDGKGNCGFLTCPMVTKLTPGYHKIAVICRVRQYSEYPEVEMNFESGHFYEVSCGLNRFFAATADIVDRGMNIDLDLEK